MAGNWTRTMGRTESEMHSFSHWAIIPRHHKIQEHYNSAALAVIRQLNLTGSEQTGCVGMFGVIKVRLNMVVCCCNTDAGGDCICHCCSAADGYICHCIVVINLSGDSSHCNYATAGRVLNGRGVSSYGHGVVYQGSINPTHQPFACVFSLYLEGRSVIDL